VPASVAAGASEALADALTGSELATKPGINSLRHELELLRRDLTIRLGGIMVVSVGVSITAIRFLPMHPWAQSDPRSRAISLIARAAFAEHSGHRA
jgi:hypothetical protein